MYERDNILQKGHANGLSRVFCDTVKYQNLRRILT